MTVIHKLFGPMSIHYSVFVNKSGEMQRTWRMYHQKQVSRQ